MAALWTAAVCPAAEVQSVELQWPLLVRNGTGVVLIPKPWASLLLRIYSTKHRGRGKNSLDFLISLLIVGVFGVFAVSCIFFFSVSPLINSPNSSPHILVHSSLSRGLGPLGIGLLLSVLAELRLWFTHSVPSGFNRLAQGHGSQEEIREGEARSYRSRWPYITAGKRRLGALS